MCTRICKRVTVLHQPQVAYFSELARDIVAVKASITFDDARIILSAVNSGAGADAEADADADANTDADADAADAEDAAFLAHHSLAKLPNPDGVILGDATDLDGVELGGMAARDNDHGKAEVEYEWVCVLQDHHRAEDHVPYPPDLQRELESKVGELSTDPNGSQRLSTTLADPKRFH